MGWAAFTILLAATLLCIKLINISMHLFAQRRNQDLASGICVCMVVAAAISALDFCGYRLYDLLSTLPWVNEPEAWLAGSGRLSLAALLGAACAIALPAYLRVCIGRQRHQPEPPKPIRSNALSAALNIRVGWLPLILLAFGAALLALAYAVAPLTPVSAPAMHPYQEYAERTWPVYVVAGVLLGAGVLLMLVRAFWRRLN